METLYGYDTVRVSSVRIQEPVIGWDSEWRYVPSGGRGALLSAGGWRSGLERYRLGDGAEVLWAEVSLPKLLWGQNVDTLGHDQLEAAFDHWDGKIHEVFPDMPRLREWELRRVDATANVLMPTQSEVVGTVNSLKGSFLGGRTPIVGDSGVSVRWPGRRGHMATKVYDKLRESGLEQARGILRVERGAVGQRAIKRAMEWERAGQVKVRDLLGCWDFAERVTRGISEMVRGKLGLRTGVPVAQALERLRSHLEAEGGLRHLAGRLANDLGTAYILTHLDADAFGIDRGKSWRVRKDWELAGIDITTLDWAAPEVRTVLERSGPEDVTELRAAL